MLSFQIGDRVVIKEYGPFWDNQAGVVRAYRAGYWIIDFDSSQHASGGFSLKYLELEYNSADFVEDLV